MLERSEPETPKTIILGSRGVVKDLIAITDPARTSITLRKSFGLRYIDFWAPKALFKVADLATRWTRLRLRHRPIRSPDRRGPLERCVSHSALLKSECPTAVEASLQSFARNKLTASRHATDGGRDIVATLPLKKNQATVIDVYFVYRIWEFLAELARGGTTVIITTHYIDETKQAHKIGLLRNGQLLAEDSPENILRSCDCDTLEEAFLQLSMSQHQRAPVRHTLSASPDLIPEGAGADHSRYSSRDQFEVCTSSTDVLTKKESLNVTKNLSRARYRAVFIKSMQQFGRHPGGLIFSLLFPIIQAVAFFAAVGHEPRGLRLAVVNDEAALSPYGLEVCTNKSLQHVTLLEDDNCDFYMLSCWFLETLEQNKLYPNTSIKYLTEYRRCVSTDFSFDLRLQVPYPNVEEAVDAVRSGTLYGALHIPYNYSSATADRIKEGIHVKNDTLAESNVAVYLDMTNHQISYYLKSQLYKIYEKYTKRVMQACGVPESLVQLPVRFGTPVSGSAEPQYVAYMAPGIMITIIFFLSAVVTSTLLIADRLEGVWERSVVAGVRAHELLNVHILIQSAVILFQTLEMMCLAFLGYGLPHQGPLFAVGLLLFLQGLSGMCYGFLLSVCCSSYTLSFFIATGSFYPMILLCVVEFEGKNAPIVNLLHEWRILLLKKSRYPLALRGYVEGAVHAGVDAPVHDAHTRPQTHSRKRSDPDGSHSVPGDIRDKGGHTYEVQSALICNKQNRDPARKDRALMVQPPASERSALR
ncbi:ABC transporter G family member 20 [Eumeta japonica]|uniref:ABC transporter G family member 20 n=1 Tax=Eumeta variegata TaxID=151549 RepID=A0A4C1SYF1_EUMVA|nr:ABC transporter G family member 20 [Eumeta japonica]